METNARVILELEYLICSIQWKERKSANHFNSLVRRHTDHFAYLISKCYTHPYYVTDRNGQNGNDGEDPRQPTFSGNHSSS